MIRSIVRPISSLSAASSLVVRPLAAVAAVTTSNNRVVGSGSSDLIPSLSTTRPPVAAAATIITCSSGSRASSSSSSSSSAPTAAATTGNRLRFHDASGGVSLSGDYTATFTSDGMTQGRVWLSEKPGWSCTMRIKQVAGRPNLTYTLTDFTATRLGLGPLLNTPARDLWCSYLWEDGTTSSTIWSYIGSNPRFATPLTSTGATWSQHFIAFGGPKGSSITVELQFA